MNDYADFLEIQTQTAWERALKEFAAWRNPPPGARILDAGCGPGWMEKTENRCWAGRAAPKNIAAGRRKNLSACSAALDLGRLRVSCAQGPALRVSAGRYGTDISVDAP